MGIDYSDIDGSPALEVFEVGDRLEVDIGVGGLTIGDITRRARNQGEDDAKQDA